MADKRREERDLLETGSKVREVDNPDALWLISSCKGYHVTKGQATARIGNRMDLELS